MPLHKSENCEIIGCPECARKYQRPEWSVNARKEIDAKNAICKILKPFDKQARKKILDFALIQSCEFFGDEPNTGKGE